MTRDRSNAMTLGALGMLSGAVVWALGYIADVDILWRVARPDFDRYQSWRVFSYFLYTLGPGFVFGLIIGSLLRRRGRVAGWRQVGYVIAAALAFFAAIFAFFRFFLWIKYQIPYFGESIAGALAAAIDGFVGGLVWSLLLGLASIPLLRVPPRVVLGLPVVIGAAFGLALPIILLHHGPDLWSWGSFVLCTLWPGAYAASLAPLLRAAPISQESIPH